ncbi:1,4-dihydroxy-2-naphthoate polyprenyltransferase [Buchananella felis]|uniref:1,4-dihydroxy-2-naphthoate polyprenyltransferase n=1 Tax=Buchananella felis TaxID=3231492 RepID=UPI003528EBBA
MANLGLWIQGARLRTLPLALAPALLANGAAYFSTLSTAYIEGHGAPVNRLTPALAPSAPGLPGPAAPGQDYSQPYFWAVAVLTTLVALALTVGVNFANDYSDGVRGTDDVRLGPARLTGGGLARPEKVRAAAFVSFGVAAAAGLAVVALSGHWWLLSLGVAAIAAAWFYTGGKRPYGYAGLGEVAVFIFFGLVAVLGILYVQRDYLVAGDLWLALPMGAYACAVLMVNNIRDIATDTTAGKHTLAVRLGTRGARWAFTALLAVPPLAAVMTAPFSTAFPFAVLLALAAAVIALPVLRGAQGRDLITALQRASALTLAYSATWVLLWVFAAL